MTKFRFRFETCDRHKTIGDSYLIKDDMIWVFDNHVVGISITHEHYKINHYNKNFDLSEYILVDDKYTLDNFIDEWFDHQLEIWDPFMDKFEMRKINV